MGGRCARWAWRALAACLCHLLHASRPATEWRVEVAQSTAGRWYVWELEVYADTLCTVQITSEGVPVPDGVGGAFDGSVGIGSIPFKSSCNGCQVGEAWVGLRFPRPTEIRCVRLMQSGADVLALIGRDGATVRSSEVYFNVYGNTWNKLRTPDARQVFTLTNAEDLVGHWRVNEAEFFGDDACNFPLERGTIIPGAAIDAFDGDPLTVYWSVCSSCSANEAYVGKLYDESQEVRCVRARTSGVGAASLWSWSAASGTWSEMHTWSLFHDSWNTLPLHSQRSAYGIFNADAITDSFAVSQILMYDDLGCTRPITARGLATPEAASAVFSPDVSAGDSFRMRCEGCAPGEAWVGMVFDDLQAVRCLRVVAPNEVDVTVRSWTEGGSWSHAALRTRLQPGSWASIDLRDDLGTSTSTGITSTTSSTTPVTTSSTSTSTRSASTQRSFAESPTQAPSFSKLAPQATTSSPAPTPAPTLDRVAPLYVEETLHIAAEAGNEALDEMFTSTMAAPTAPITTPQSQSLRGVAPTTMSESVECSCSGHSASSSIRADKDLAPSTRGSMAYPIAVLVLSLSLAISLLGHLKTRREINRLSRVHARHGTDDAAAKSERMRHAAATQELRAQVAALEHEAALQREEAARQRAMAEEARMETDHCRTEARRHADALAALQATAQRRAAAPPPPPTPPPMSDACLRSICTDIDAQVSILRDVDAAQRGARLKKLKAQYHPDYQRVKTNSELAKFYTYLSQHVNRYCDAHLVQDCMRCMARGCNDS